MYPSAQLNLGIILANRRGPGRDIPGAMALYRHAVESRYRFFSYGDAMLLKRS